MYPRIKLILTGFLFVLIGLLAKPGYAENLSSSYFPYIVNTIDFHGDVAKVVSSSTGNITYVLVTRHSNLTTADKPGVYIFDSTDAPRLKKIGYLPTKSAYGFDLSDDGQALLVYESSSRPTPENPNGIRVYSVTDPRQPKLLQSIHLNVSSAWLNKNDVLTVFVRHWNEPTLRFTTVFFKLKQQKLHKFASSAASSYGAKSTYSGDKYIIAGGNPVSIYDANLGGKLVLSGEIKTKCTHSFGLTQNLLWVCGEDNELKVIDVKSGNTVGSVKLPDRWIYDGFMAGKTTVAVVARSLSLVDISNPDDPKVVSRYSLPSSAGGTYLADKTFQFPENNKPFYYGLVGRMVMIDPSKRSTASGIALMKAHEASLRQYNRSLKNSSSHSQAVYNAINIMDAAGIRQAIKAKPSDINNRQFAAVLNDYAFWLSQIHYRSSNAISLLRRVIVLDPHRKIAYLNLADLLQETLGATDNFDDKKARSIEIASLYRKYLKLGGHATKAINSFLTLNPSNHNNLTACEAVATYSNANRLRELFVTGNSVPVHGHRINVKISVEGTAHVPYVEIIDADTGKPPTKDLGITIPDAEHLWGGDELAVLAYGKQFLLLHYRDAKHPVAATNLSGRDDCSFSVQTTEVIGKNAPEPALCRQLQSTEITTPSPLCHSRHIIPHVSTYCGAPKGASEINVFKFKKQAWLSRKDVQQRYSETGITGSDFIDVGNSGKPINIGRFELASGAGPGCDEIFFDALNNNGNQFQVGPAHALLMDVQNADQPHYRYPLIHCGNFARFFQYKGETYYENRPGTWPPEDRFSQYHRVARAKDGNVEDVCRFRFKTMVKVDPQEYKKVEQ